MCQRVVLRSHRVRSPVGPLRCRGGGRSPLAWREFGACPSTAVLLEVEASESMAVGTDGSLKERERERAEMCLASNVGHA